MATADSEYRVILSRDATRALIKEQRPRPGEEGEVSACFEVLAPSFVQIEMSPQAYEAALTYGPYGFHEQKDHYASVGKAVAAIKESYRSYEPDLNPEQKTRYAEELKQSTTRADDEQRRRRPHP